MNRLSLGIGARIFIGFAALIVLGVVIGVAGFISLTRVSTAGSISNLAHEVQLKISEARIFEKEYLIKKDDANYNHLMKCLDELSSLAASLKEGMDKTSEVGDINNGQQVYRQAMVEIKKLEEDDAKTLKDLQAMASNIALMAEEESARTSGAVKSDIMQSNAKALKDYALDAIKNITAVGFDVLKYHHDKGLPKAEALESVRNLHFAGSNYFFVVQEDLTLVAHGSDRNLEGKDFGKIQDKKTGKTFMKEVVDSAIKNGDSYTEYFWNKPGMGDSIFPKVTFAKYFKPWGLVICAGVYIDDIEDQVRETGKLVEIGLNKLQQANDIKVSMLETRLNTLYFFSFGQNADKVATGVSRLKTLAASNDKLKQNADTYLENFNRNVRNSSTRVKDVNQIDTAAAQTSKIASGIGSHALDEFSNTASSGKIFISAFILAGALIGLFFATLLARAIIKPITRAIKGIVETSEQVASASSQVSSASQQLAEGSSEQAASLEETSSALEEMTSMTKQNADNAIQANELTQESRQIVGEANQTMTRLTASMAEISRASEQTQKIVKTIDEIAFQTNLLALNAAVEAARAGEAGAGFAVVADEVRNLAMRAAEAAKNTAGMIESTVTKVKEGSSLVDKTNLDFRKVATCVTKSGELISEIAAASNEQSQGIEQINSAIAKMDKVVQENSANAEESASASQQMDAQAKNLEDYLKDLVTLIGGTSKGKTHKWNREPKCGLSAQKHESDSIGIIQAANRTITGNGKANKKSRATPVNRFADAIPFHDDGMDSF
jgi:hypothetical protein